MQGPQAACEIVRRVRGEPQRWRVENRAGWDSPWRRYTIRASMRGSARSNRCVRVLRKGCVEVHHSECGGE